MVYLYFICISSAAPAWAQHEHHDAEAPTSGWAWSADASVFLTANFQVRAFTDFYQVESQNWFMGAGTRRVGVGTVSLEGMLSLEPFTLRDLGTGVWGVVSLGGDATGFHTPDNLFESYGHPFSGHLHVHWAPR